MGMRHGIHVVASLPDGTCRPIDAIAIPSEVPDSRDLKLASHLLSVFKTNKDLIGPELARAETLPSDVWNRDAGAEYRQCRDELEEAQKRFEAEEGTRAEVKSLKSKAAQLKKEAMAAFLPQFPAVRACLILGILNAPVSSFLYSLSFRPWNSPPDWGAWETGSVILNLTDGSFAYVVPGRRECGWACKSTYDALKLRPLSGEQYLKAFGQGNEYCWPVRVSRDAGPAPVMPMTAIQAAWPSFPSAEQDDADEEDGGNDDYDGLDRDLIVNSTGDKSIFRDESQRTDPEANRDDENRDERRRALMDDEQRRKLDHRLRELLLKYTQSKLASHKFDEHFPGLVDAFIREHSEEFTSEMPGAVPLLLTAQRYPTWKMCHALWLDLSHYHNLPGETVVDLVRTVVSGNRAFLAKRKKRDVGEPAPLWLLDVSFNHNVTADHMARILKLTRLRELRIWDNPGLAAVWDERIDRLTSRERYLQPIRRLIEQLSESRRRRDGPVRSWPPPPMGPGPARIRQLVWTTLKTIESGYTQPPAALEWLQLPRPGSVSLARLDADQLAWILHPRFRNVVKDAGQKMPIFGETVALPLHEAWAPRCEVYTSVVRFKEYMTTRFISRYGHSILEDRWPLKLALLMATGRERHEAAITSPLPAELLDLAWHESVGNGSHDKRMRLHGFDAVVPGEFTLVLLHEPDSGTLHHGLVTRAPDGRLEVRDPAAVAREAGDDAAANTWARAFTATETRRYPLLDAPAVEKLLAASTRLAQRKNRSMYVLRRFLEDCTEEVERAAERQPPPTAAPAEEHEYATVKMEQEGAEAREQEDGEVKNEQEDVEMKKEGQDVEVEKEPKDAEVREESGCKRALAEEPENHEAAPRMKRLKRRVS